MTMLAILYVATNIHLIQAQMNLSPEEIKKFDQDHLTSCLNEYYHGISFESEEKRYWIDDFVTYLGDPINGPHTVRAAEAYWTYKYNEDKIDTEFVEITHRKTRRRR